MDKIAFPSVTSEFDHYLNQIEKKGIFSGRFGMGKTTFLKDYFKENESEYNVVHLFPVNYSVVDNRDIITLIKYDIIYELLDKDIQFDEFNFKKSDLISQFIKRHPEKISYQLLKSIPALGKKIEAVVKPLIELNESFQKFSNDLQSSELSTIQEFISQVESDEYSIFENDIVTDLINDLLVQLRCSSDNATPTKENILIIDDLERLDPEHAFRILNVFASQIDVKEGASKFEFDKIIFVFDVDNLKTLFHHKYGKEAYFEGYIDKFYNRSIYHFDNIKYISEQVNLSIEKTTPSDNSTENTTFRHNFTYSGYCYKLIAALVRNLVLKNLLSLRSIAKKRFEPLPISISLRDERIISYNYPVLTSIEYIKEYYGSYESLLEVLNKLKNIESSALQGQVSPAIISSLVIISDYENHNFGRTSESIYNYKNIFNYSITSRGYEYNAEIKMVDEAKINILELLIDTIIVIKSSIKG